MSFIPLMEREIDEIRMKVFEPREGFIILVNRGPRDKFEFCTSCKALLPRRNGAKSSALLPFCRGPWAILSAISIPRVGSLCASTLSEAMPRLGEDPNVATAYPNRLNTNLRGSWMRQCINTLLSSLLIVFVFNKLMSTNYKVR